MPPAAAAAVAKAEASGMFFFYPVLKALNDGRIIRRAVIIVLQILAVLSVLGALFLVFTSLSGATLPTILAMVVMLAAILCVAQIFWYRAASVRDLEAEPEDHFGAKFTVIPIASMLFRMVGEVSATMLVGAGIAAFLIGILSSSSSGGMAIPMPGLPFPMGGSGIGPALISLVGMGAAAFVSIVVFYLLAESTVVMVDVAQHIRILVKQGESKK
jgi:hypothetical protein